MARPREFSDEVIFHGVYLALCKKGYGSLALTDVSKEIEISPAALLKRFGSKKNLMLAYSDYVIDLTKKSFMEVSNEELTSIDGLKGVFKSAVRLASDPIALANHTSFYLESTRDPDLLEKSQYRLRIIDDETQRLLNLAIERKEIKACDVAIVSNVLQASISGAMLLWIKDTHKTLDELIDGCFKVIFDSLEL